MLNGAADGYVPAADLAAFQQEMVTAGADWQLVQLGGAVHCFTETDANSPGGMYDARAATRAYAMMEDLLGEVFREDRKQVRHSRSAPSLSPATCSLNRDHRPARPVGPLHRLGVPPVDGSKRDPEHAEHQP